MFFYISVKYIFILYVLIIFLSFYFTAYIWSYFYPKINIPNTNTLIILYNIYFLTLTLCFNHNFYISNNHFAQIQKVEIY